MKKNKAEDARIEEEKQRKLAEEEEARLAEENRKKSRAKRIKLTVCGSVAGVVVVSAGILGTWLYMDKGRMSTAAELTKSGDYQTAIETYSKVFPLGSTGKEARQLSYKLKQASQFAEEAKKNLEEYDYISAMENADKAMQYCPDLPGSDATFATAKAELERYFKKKYNAKEYTSVLSINNVRTDWRSKEMISMVTEVNNLIVDNIKYGNKMLENNNPTEAYNYAKAALAIDANNEGAQYLCKLISANCIEQANTQLSNGNIDSALTFASLARESNSNNEWLDKLDANISSYKEEYNKYEAVITNARASYNKGDISSAYNQIMTLPSSGIGAAVASKNSSFINTIKSDKANLSNPVTLIDTWAQWELEMFDTFYMTFTYKNKLSRPIKIKVKCRYNSTTGYATYTIPAYTSSELKYTFNEDAFFGGRDYDVTVVNWWVQ